MVNIGNMTAMIIKDIPDEVRKRFRIYCLERNMTMKELLTWLMTEIPKGNVLSCPIEGKKK